MYQIRHIKEENCLELSNTTINFLAKIYLDLGGSLQKLTLNNKQIIREFSTDSIEKKYASSILFPFSGRVKKGKYTFNDTDYQLKINNLETKSALHGLVYNKQFKLLNYLCTEESQTVILKYNETERNLGFPFKYTIILSYTFTKDATKLKVKVQNNDEDPFPFSLGWHPYFYTNKLSESKLNIKSSQKVSFNNQLIPLKLIKKDFNEEIGIQSQHLDDCYKLTKNTINFKSPEYSIQINSSSRENFVQIYTPTSEKKHIAIEPLTAIPNSLNNKIGLNWEIKLEKDTTKNTSTCN